MDEATRQRWAKRRWVPFAILAGFLLLLFGGSYLLAVRWEREQRRGPSEAISARWVAGSLVVADRMSYRFETRVTTFDPATGRRGGSRIEDSGYAVGSSFDCSTVDEVALAGPPLSLHGAGRRYLVVGSIELESAARPTASFWQAGFLVDDHGAPIVVDGVDPLLLHVDPRAGQQLSRIAAGGAVVWTATIRGRCQLAAIVDGTLVVATRSESSRAVAVDLATGGIRWRAGF